MRLAGLVALGATVVLATAALVAYHDLSREISGAITTELQLRFDTLAAEAEDAGLVDQHAVVGQTVDESGAVRSPVGALPLLTDAELRAALGGQLIIDRSVPGIGANARLLARPLPTSGGHILVGVAAASTAPLERARDRFLLILLLAGPALAGAITVTAWILAGAALRPVRLMAARASTISMSAPGERLPEPGGGDEIAQLGRTLNQMLDRIEATVAHERAFIDDASHELRTPLAVLRGELELAALDAKGVPTVVDGLHSALEETDRLTRLTENLLTLARADAGQLKPGHGDADLLDAARAAVARLQVPDQLTVTIAGVAGPVAAEPEWLGQIITNLVTNAIRYARHDIRVEVARSPIGVELIVADDGPGFPPSVLPSVFDRFVRADNARSRGGTGLGLAIVASLVDALGGAIRADNGPPLGGARVEVTLPGTPIGR